MEQDLILNVFDSVIKLIVNLEDDKKIETINLINEKIQSISPFLNDPISKVLWVPLSKIKANDYNPNTVAPPEMKLLSLSIQHDGYTQPVVVWENEAGQYEIVDGFHRSRVAREDPDVAARMKGYLPVTVIQQRSEERNNRIAATVRHNRARGKHSVDGMSEIVLELKNRNWKNERIAKELGMEQDEILRLCQITGLYELFADSEFSKSWDVEGAIDESDFADFEEITDVLDENDETAKCRVVNTGDENRIFHTYEKWECYKYGFYATHKDGMNKKECEEAYRAFLSDIPRFSEALSHVISEWKHSCEHYLTNVAMNRIAWLGQAAICYDSGIPSCFRGGFFLLSPQDQKLANLCALEYLNKWMVNNGRQEITLEEAYSGDRQSDIY